MNYSKQQKKAYNELKKRLIGYMSSVQSIYDNISAQAADIALKSEYDPESNEVFSFSDYPEQRTAIQKMQNNFVTDLSNLIDRGVTKEWQMSNEAQNLLINSMVESAGVRLNNFYQKKFWQYNDEALNAFKRRKDKGMGLSTKIWQQSSELKTQLEDTISVAIQRGMSAITLSKRISQYLQNYPKLKQDYGEKFGTAIRCRDCEYKSIRLARTEINMSYRMAEQERWRNLDFVLGYRIKLSKNHTCKGVINFVDICDDLAGDYPKDFIWAGWHPSCRCYAIPILISEAEFEKLNLGETTTENPITEMPKQFNEWLVYNADRIEKAQERGTLPYFLRDNKEILSLNSIVSLNKMSANEGTLVGYYNISNKEKNYIISQIKQLSKKIGIFNDTTIIEFTNNLNDCALMSFNNKSNTLTISTCKYKMENDTILCPAENLLKAFTKLKSKRNDILSFNEEYTIETLFHEHIHSKDLNFYKKTNKLNDTILEISTQLYARNNYPKILKYYKKNPYHFDAIQTEGYGYKQGCEILRRFFTKNGQLQVGELINLSNGTEEGIKKLRKKFAEFNISTIEQKSILFFLIHY